MVSIGLALVLTACATEQQAVKNDDKPKEVVVGTYDVATSQVTGVNKGAVPSAFKDGTVVANIEIKHAGETFFLFRSGHRKSGDSITEATELAARDGHLMLMAGKKTYSCTGNPCNQCAFKNDDKPADGCKCIESEGTGYRCNHTVSESE